MMNNDNQHDPTDDDHALRGVLGSMELGDLCELVDEPGPFATVLLNSPSRFADADDRLATRWRTARRTLENDWRDERLASLDDLVDGIAHDDGEAIAIVQAASGVTLTASLGEPLTADVAYVDALPRLATIIEDRQRTLPHIVVVTDRTGADIVAFDGGSVVDADEVTGSTLHVHRGHPGGWSQRRFQQRAENTWEQNANVVADAVTRLAREVDPVVICIAGDVRAKNLVADALDSGTNAPVVLLDAGDPEGISDEVVRIVSDQVARAQRTLITRLRDGLHDGNATGFDGIFDALLEGRVDTLLVHDDDSDEPRVSGASADDVGDARAVDSAIRAALRSDADIVVVPGIAAMGGPVAGLLRWST